MRSIAIRLYFRFLKKLRGKEILDSSVHPSSKIEAGSQFRSSTLGRCSYCGYDCTIMHTSIGAFVSIADEVIIGASSHPMQYVSTSPSFLSHRDSVKTKYANFDYSSSKFSHTRISHDVWIGSRVIIKSGVSVEVGCVIGMGSVLTKSTEPYGIYAGNPARLIRYRFSEEIINQLLKLSWWNFSDEDLLLYGKYFNNPSAFIEAYNQK